MTRPKGDMEFETFSRVIDELVAVNPGHAGDSEVWLHGFGESTVHPRFAEFMRYATDRGVNACLSVNPLMLTPKVGRELLDARPGTLYLSLDGHDNQSFEQIRGLAEVYDKSKERLSNSSASSAKCGAARVSSYR
jgi:MoaA/NifB/PqqE/SkfB family radical SAM enzyme